jgi:hypothetical protein
MSNKQSELRAIAVEVVRRVGPIEGVIYVTVPPTPAEELQLLAAELQGAQFVISPKKWEQLEEWFEYSAARFLRDGAADEPQRSAADSSRRTPLADGNEDDGETTRSA